MARVKWFAKLAVLATTKKSKGPITWRKKVDEKLEKLMETVLWKLCCGNCAVEECAVENNGTKSFFSRICDHTVKWRGSRGLPSWPWFCDHTVICDVRSAMAKFYNLSFNLGFKSCVLFYILPFYLGCKFCALFYHLPFDLGCPIFYPRACDPRHTSHLTPDMRTTSRPCHVWVPPASKPVLKNVSLDWFGVIYFWPDYRVAGSESMSLRGRATFGWHMH